MKDDFERSCIRSYVDHDKIRSLRRELSESDEIESQRLFGLQLLLDFALNKNKESFNPGRVVQLTLHTIDFRFIRPGIIPYLALSYRNEKPDQIAGDTIENSAGWFIYGIGALDVRISSSYHLNLSVSGPVVRGINGVDLRQVNFGVALRWTSPSD